MIQQTRRTKIVWSIFSEQELSEPFFTFLRQEVEVLRIVYNEQSDLSHLGCLPAIEKYFRTHKIAIPIAVDFSPTQALGPESVFLHWMRAVSEFAVDCVIIPSAGMPLIGPIPQRTEKGSWRIIKIDSQQAYQNIAQLLDGSDGVMISRKDLAESMDPASIPMISKDIIQKGSEKAKLVFIASETLASMRTKPTPTRAEVSDIANAVIDATDAIVLSEELSLGAYQEKSIALCRSIIDDLEENQTITVNWKRAQVVLENELDVVAYHAFQTALRIEARALVCITRTGNTVSRLASFRSPVPIIAVAFAKEMQRKLSLVRGVSSVILDVDPALDEVLPNINERLKRDSWLQEGDKIVLVSVSLSPVGRNASNLFTVQRLK